MYRLIKFGQTSIEHYNQVDSIGTGSTPTAYQDLPEGGALDLYGNQQKNPGAVERTKTMRLTAPTEAALETLFMQLFALRGKRDRLYRQMSSGDIHWQYARLVEITAERSYEITKYKRVQDVSLRFVTQETFWRGDLGGQWYFDSGEYFDTGLVFDSARTYPLTASPTAFTVSVGAAADAGRAASRAIRMEISAGDASMSAITMQREDGETVVFSGTVLANKTLVIDTGTMQVKNDGVNAYNDLTLSSTADLAAWFAFEPGPNNISVSFTGGGVGRKIEFYYYEVWY